jgi:hypothetical protein
MDELPVGRGFTLSPKRPRTLRIATREQYQEFYENADR